MSTEKRRKVTRNGKCCTLVGSCRELPLADLPTYSDVVAYSNLIQERSDTPISLAELVKTITKEIVVSFGKVGTDIPLIDKSSVEKNSKGS